MRKLSDQISQYLKADVKQLSTLLVAITVMYPIKDKGSSLLLMITLLFCLSGIAIGYLKTQIHSIKLTQNSNKTFLCAKEMNGVTQRLINQMNTSNKVLRMLTVTNLTTIILPQIGILAKVSIKKAIKIAKFKQKADIVLYLKKLAHLRSKKCKIPYKAFKTPYLIKGLSLKRNKFNEAIYKDKKWKWLIKGKRISILNTYTAKAKIRSYLVKKENPFSRLLSWAH